MTEPLISSPAGVMTVLIAVPAFRFWVERATGARVFEFLPPLIFIYAAPAT